MTRHSIKRKALFRGLIVGFISTLLAIGLWRLRLSDTWEAKSWDWRVSVLAQKGSATDDIRLILLDQNSLDWAREENGLTWPWPRELYAAIINFCQRAGARAFAFDVLVSEPSSYGVQDDQTLGKAAAAFGRMTAAVHLGETGGSASHWPAYLSSPQFNLAGADEWLAENSPSGVTFSRAVMPVPEVAGKARVLSNVHLEPDADGVYRRVKLFGLFDGKFLPTLGIGAYLADSPTSALDIKHSHFIVDSHSAPMDDAGNVILRFRGPAGTYQRYSAAAILQSEIRMRSGETPPVNPVQAFKNKFVFFGFSAPGLFDLRPTSVGGIFSGVEIHATILDNLLSGDFMQATPAWITLALTAVLAHGCAIWLSLVSSPVKSAAISTGCIATPLVIVLGAYQYGYWLPLAVVEIGLLAAASLSIIANFATEGRQKRFVKNAFKHYLSPTVIDQLIANPDLLKLGGERRVISIFFSDLQQFTAISETLDPETLTAFLNDYLSAMTDIILEEGGTVDKYEGDAIIAFWNAPLAVEGHAPGAVRAALRCQARLAEMRAAFKASVGKDVFMRIGINTGQAVVGNLGSEQRFDYTMIGDAVNLAARLESANKQFGTFTMISQFTNELLGDEFRSRELARLTVVGRKEPIMVYEPMFKAEFDVRKQPLETFACGLEHFYSGRFKKAEKNFILLKDRDPAAVAYSAKCRRFTAATPAKWDGVWIMSRK